jgi:hypothetical protein
MVVVGVRSDEGDRMAPSRIAAVSPARLIRFDYFTDFRRKINGQACIACFE